MRKALMSMILAATAMAPAAAWAQDWHNRGDHDGGRVHNQNEGEHVGDHHARSESRQTQQQPQVQVQQQQQQVPAVQNNHNNWRGRDGNGGGNNAGNGGGNNNAGNGGNNGGNGDGNRRNWRGGDNNRTSIYPQAWQGDPNDPRLRHYQEVERRNQNGGRNDWRDNRNDRNDGRGRRSDWRGDRHDRNWQGNWNRGWRSDHRYDWNGWRYRNRSIFHLSPYYAPYRNWGYRRFSIGFFLDSLFFDQRYWIGDPYDYRLPPAPPGTEWVRYYNDVLLVDIDSGEVVDVIYDFFW